MQVASWHDAYAGLLPPEHIERRSVEVRTAQWNGRLRGGGEFALIACEPDGSVVGFTSGGPSSETVDGYDAEIGTLYLLPRAQGRGVGEQLLRAMGAALVAKGFRAAWLRVLSDNSRARRFYEKCGGEAVCQTTEDIDGFLYREHYYGWRDLTTLSDPSPKRRPKVPE